ncbi:uncharacterized protein DDB_G0267764-like [Eurosta solidaginis]|uniref:uncharacterized protein DDB_G0267764-like n=1 Tax=Eurosta solidaginis TaxID=178769 RepID=UPI003530C2F6
MDNFDVSAKFKLISTNLNSVPPYDGNENALLGFVERIDLMIPTLESFPDDLQVLLIGNIKDKIVGNARRSLLINGNPHTWELVRKVLVDNHGEKNSVDEIIDKIRSCRCESTIEHFYNQLNTLLCRLNNALQLSNTKIAGINYESNGRIALNSFKHGLPEPVKSIIVSRNPKDLKSAYDIIKSNGYLKYNDRHSFFNNNNSRYKQQNRTNRFSSELYNTNNSNVQNNMSNKNDLQFNNNVSRGHYYNNHNDARFQQQLGQHSRNGLHPNASVQSRLYSNSSGQTNRSQNPYRESYFIPNTIKTQFNGDPGQATVEPMELGVNENNQDFQLAPQENYLI